MYSIRVGSESVVGGCPPPDQPKEVVLLQYTCNGGIEWNTIETLTPQKFQEPMLALYKLCLTVSMSNCIYVIYIQLVCEMLFILTLSVYSRVMSIRLPVEARQALCRFRWTQPHHSGYGHDLWAIDDVSLTSQMYNNVYLDFSDAQEVTESVEVHLGTVNMYCGKLDTLRSVLVSKTNTFHNNAP